MTDQRRKQAKRPADTTNNPSGRPPKKTKEDSTPQPNTETDADEPATVSNTSADLLKPTSVPAPDLSAGSSATTTNPQAANALAALIPLPRIRFRMPDNKKNPIYPPLTDFKQAFTGAIADRLQTIDLLQPNSKSLFNLAMINPKDAHVPGQYLTIAGADLTPARFFLSGLTAHCSLCSGAIARSISVAFSAQTFPRAMAVLGQVYGKTSLALPSFFGGVSLSTYKKNGEHKSSPSKLRAAPPSPTKSKSTGKSTSTKNPSKPKWGEPVLNWNDTVPIYDGRNKFSPQSFQTLPLISDELLPNTAVLVIFTVGTYKAAAPMKASLNTVVSFNIQAVVLLANPDLDQENFSAIDFDDCVPVGVDGDEPNDTEDEAESSLTAGSGDEDANNEWI